MALRDQVVLMTGATGFLGSNLLPRLVEQGHQVIILKRSFSNVSRIAPLLSRVSAFDIDRIPLSRVFDERKVDIILHCATNYGRRAVPPTVITEANLTLPLQLLQLAAPHGVRAFVNTDTILDKRMNHYTLSKKQFVEWMRMLSGDFACVNVALEHFFGSFDDRSKFVSSILLDLIDQVPRIDLTPGQQKRDFIYIDDVVTAFLSILEFVANAAPGLHRFEVGTGTSISIMDFVHLAKDMTGNAATMLNFGALPYREGEVMESRADTTALRALGWTPRVSLKEGMVEMIAQERRNRRA